MLAGFVLLGQIAGTYEISAMASRAADIQAHPHFVPALVLILDRRVHQERAVSIPFLVARRHGRAHACVGLSAFGHHGQGRGVFVDAPDPGAGWPGWFELAVTAVGLVTVLFAAFIALFSTT